MTILIAIVHVGTPMIVHILARAFNPIVETPALNVVELPGRSVPVAPILAVA